MDESLQLHFFLGLSLGLYVRGLDMLAGTHSCIKEFVNTNLLLMIIRFEFQIQIDAWILFPWLQLQVSEISKFDAYLCQQFMY